MPELPEVENVCRGLSKAFQDHGRIVQVHFFRKKLRFPMPENVLKACEHNLIKQIFRRAKYIVFDFGAFKIINHLGMTGTWRIEKKAKNVKSRI